MSKFSRVLAFADLLRVSGRCARREDVFVHAMGIVVVMLLAEVLVISERCATMP